jgi:hypothetical protein
MFSFALLAAVQSSDPLHPFWYDLGGEIQHQMKHDNHYRKGDVIISVPGKSGTTWTMNIVHQLRTGGDPTVRDIYEEVPWLEFWEKPTQSTKQLIAKFDAMPKDQMRAFKTHSAIGQNSNDYNPELKYVVVMRNPADSAASFVPFLAAHTKAFVEDFWHAGAMMPKFSNADQAWKSPFMRSGNSSIEFMQSFWPHRHEKNVLVMHFTDMKKDHVGTIKKVANFLGIKLPQKKFHEVCEYTSYNWMKKHGDKFTIQHLCDVPVLAKNGMVRNGAVGEGRTALSADTIRDFQKKLSDLVTPEQAEWLMNGGSIA